MDQYFASVEERDILCCFLVFKDVGELPSIINYPIRDRRVKGHPAQLESHHPYNCKSQLAHNSIPWPRLPFR